MCAGKARQLCTSCSDECRARGLRLGHKHYCLEDQFFKGENPNDDENYGCDPNCNNRECGYDGPNTIETAKDGGQIDGDCGISEIIEKCNPAQMKLKATYNYPPANRSGLTMLGTNKRGAKTPIELQITSMQPLTLDLDSASNQWSIQVDMNLQIRWRDARFKTMPCSYVIPQLIGIDSATTKAERIEAEAIKAYLWWPTLQISHKQIDYLVDAATGEKTIFSGKLTYLDGTEGADWVTDDNHEAIESPDGASYCHDCMNHTLRVKTKLDLKEPTPQFHFYPFDTQHLTFTFAMKDAHIFSCEHIFSSMNMTTANMAPLLPTTGEWTAIALDAYHEYDDVQTCKVDVTVRRNSVIFVIKQVLPSTIVMYAGMSALYMNSLEHTGDRTASILVAALILMVNFQTDLGLGKITYLVWWDMYNLISIMILILILCLSLWEKILVDTGENAKATDMNRVQRVAFLFLAYPIVALWLLLLGLSEDYGNPLAWTILVVGLVGLLVATLFAYKRIHNAGIRQREAVVTKLKGLSHEDEIFPDVLKDAFDAYDVDASGKLDTDELRDLLKAIVTTADSKLFAEISLAIKGFADAGGELSYNAFHDSLVTVLPKYSGIALNANSAITGAHVKALSSPPKEAKDASALAGAKESINALFRAESKKDFHVNQPVRVSPAASERQLAA